MVSVPDQFGWWDFPVQIPQGPSEAHGRDLDSIGRPERSPVRCVCRFHHAGGHAGERLHGRYPLEFTKETYVLGGIVVVRDLQKAAKLCTTSPGLLA